MLSEGVPVSVAEYAANKIRQHISDEALKPGDIIGSEERTKAEGCFQRMKDKG